MSETDVIVLGVGTCGEDLSLRLLGAGLEVVGIEAALVGGECAYWACLPSKRLIRTANLLEEARRVNGIAGEARVAPDWSLVAAQLREQVTGGWDDAGAVARYESRGGRLIHGRGKLNGPNSVSVNGETITARRGIVIATGSQPSIPPIPGLSDVDYWTTHDVIALEELPQSLLILGGGAVGCELGQVLARYGVSVGIIEAGGRLLPSEEPEASAVVEAALAGDWIAIHTGQSVVRVASNGSRIVVSLAGGGELSAERLLVATGRKVDLSGLGLEKAGLDGTGRSIPVDTNMQAAESIWAMGDVTGKAMFTHVALYQSAIVAAEILGQDHIPARYDAVPRVIFTDPEVGSVGMTEAQATAAGHDVVAITRPLPSTFRGWLHATGDGVIKLIADRKSGLLLGATAVGPSGGEMLGMLTLAVHARLPVGELQSMIYAFPTFHGAIGETVGAYGRGLSTVMAPDYDGFTVLESVGIGGE